MPRTVGVAAGRGHGSSILAQQRAPCRSAGLGFLGEDLPRPPSPCGPGARLCPAGVSALGVGARGPSGDGGRARAAPPASRSPAGVPEPGAEHPPGGGGQGAAAQAAAAAVSPRAPAGPSAASSPAWFTSCLQPLCAWGLEAAVSWTSARAGPRLAPLPGPSPASFGVSPSRAAGTPFVSAPSHLPPRRLAFQAFH